MSISLTTAGSMSSVSSCVSFYQASFVCSASEGLLLGSPVVDDCIQRMDDFTCGGAEPFCDPDYFWKDACGTLVTDFWDACTP